MADRSPWPRRLIMPLAILVAAAALTWWGSRLDSERHFAVHDFVRTVCDDVRAGRDPAPRLAATDTLVRDTLLRRLGAGLDPEAKLTIEVSEGDTPEAGSAAGTATHVAVIKQDGAPVLRLRAIAGPTGVAIIGFF